MRTACAIFLTLLASLPLRAQESGAKSDSGESTEPNKNAPLPGTSQTPILPGLGTVPSFQERRPSPRNPAYQPPVSVPGFDQSKVDPGMLFLFSGGEFDMQRWLSTRNKQTKTSRAEEALYDEEPNGGKSRVESEGLYLEQFGLNGFPYGAHRHDESESSARRFSIVFLVSLPITMAASYGLFRLGKSAARQSNEFTRGQTLGMALLGLGMSAGIGVYDLRQYNKLERTGLGRDQVQASVTLRF